MEILFSSMTLQMCVVERKRILFSGMWVHFCIYLAKWRDKSYKIIILHTEIKVGCGNCCTDLIHLDGFITKLALKRAIFGIKVEFVGNICVTQIKPYVYLFILLSNEKYIFIFKSVLKGFCKKVDNYYKLYATLNIK